MSYNKKKVYVRGNFKIEHGKGRLYEIYDPINNKTIEEWFPTSLVSNEVVVDVEKDIVEFEFPQWLIEKKGFNWFDEVVEEPNS